MNSESAENDNLTTSSSTSAPIEMKRTRPLLGFILMAVGMFMALLDTQILGVHCTRFKQIYQRHLKRSL